MSRGAAAGAGPRAAGRLLGARAEDAVGRRGGGPRCRPVGVRVRQLRRGARARRAPHRPRRPGRERRWSQLHELAGPRRLQPQAHRAAPSATSAALLRLDPDFSLDPFVVPAAGGRLLREAASRRWPRSWTCIRAGAPAAQRGARREAEERAALARQAEEQRRRARGAGPPGHRAHGGEAQLPGELRPLRRRAVPAGPQRPPAPSSRPPRARSR